MSDAHDRLQDGKFRQLGDLSWKSQQTTKDGLPRYDGDGQYIHRGFDWLSQEEQRKVWSDIERAVSSQAWHTFRDWQFGFASMEDYIQEGYYAVVKALPRCTHRGTPAHTIIGYAIKAVRRHYLDLVRHHRAQMRDARLTVEFIQADWAEYERQSTGEYCIRFPTEAD